MEVTKKIGYLEGIRGVAAMLVMLHHFLLAFYPSYYLGGDPTSLHLPHNLELRYWQNPLSFITNGEFMVAIFFILSGYVLSRSYFQKPDTDYLKSAASRRFLRLYIPVSIALILAYIVLRCNFGLIEQAVYITHCDWLSQTAQDDRSFMPFFKCLLYNTMFISDNRYVTTTWSISIELYGSMMVFLLLALTRKTKGKWFFFLVAGFIGYFFFSDYYLAFALGMCLNYIDKLDIDKLPLRGILVSVLLISGCIMGGFPTWQWTPEKMTFYHFVSAPIFVNNAKTIHIFGAALIVISAMLSKTFQKLFSGKLFIFLGDISFSAYLIHPIIVTTLSLLIFLETYNITNHYAISVLVSLISTIAITIVLAKLMTVYVDKPGVRFSKYVYTRFFKAKETV